MLCYQYETTKMKCIHIQMNNNQIHLYFIFLFFFSNLIETNRWSSCDKCTITQNVSVYLCDFTVESHIQSTCRYFNEIAYIWRVYFNHLAFSRINEKSSSFGNHDSYYLCQFNISGLDKLHLQHINNHIRQIPVGLK